MKQDYLIVHKQAVPDYFMKVVEVRKQLELHPNKSVAEICRQQGLSRSTYYKYKDEIFLPEDNEEGHKAVLSIVLAHQEGCLSRILTMLSDMHANILTISQTMPLAGKANVLLCIETQDMNLSLNQAIKKMTKVKGVQNIQLLNVE
jgi:chorismate mutase